MEDNTNIVKVIRPPELPKPNQTGELMCVVDGTHDPVTDTSRVGFAFATVPLIRMAFNTEGYYEIAPTARVRAALTVANATAGV